jgi:hypothetical protein
MAQSTVSGNGNNISGTSANSRNIILGGTTNTISSSVGASADNIILGGNANAITGAMTNSVAGGNNATVANINCFIYSTGNALSTSVANQFTVKSLGGSRFFSNTTATVGVSLAAGGNSWASVCDVNVKENLEECNYSEVLNKVSTLLPIYTYNYIGNQPEQKCFGPTAQDWNSTFVVGEMISLDPENGEPIIDSKTSLPKMVPAKDPCMIETMDMIGVLLCSVKELKNESNILRSEANSLLNSETSTLDMISNLQARINSLSIMIS